MQFDYNKAVALETMTDKLLHAARALCSREDYKMVESLTYLVGELRLCADLIEGGYIEGAKQRWVDLLEVKHV